MRKIGISLALVAVLGLALVVGADVTDIWAAYRPSLGTAWRVTQDGHLQPGGNTTFDLGSTSKYTRNAYIQNLTVGGTYSFDSVGSSGETTVGGNLTVNATAVLNATNTTGLLTTNNVVVNGTMNTTGLATLDNCTVNGTVNVGGPVILGRTTVNATNTTIAATCSTIIAVTNMTGNHTLTFSSPAAGTTFVIVDESGKLGSTGNFTVNVTSGTINGVNNITWTNTTSTDPATGSNVTALRFHAISTTAGYTYR